ncbi:MAG: NAD(P)H-dependent glycerol-3-phosphate dehydrogenase [Bacillota bacterium]
MNKKIAVIGGGSWGTAIAENLTKNNFNVYLYAKRAEQVKEMIKTGRNKDYFPDYKLSDLIIPTNDLKEAVSNRDIVFISVPTSATREVSKKLKKYISKDAIVVSTAKGIDEDSFLTNSEMISEELTNKIAVLSGPTHSEEVILDKPSAAVVASKDMESAKAVQKVMSNIRFRTYTNPDIIGVELGGAIKNIIALAAGIIDGLDYGDNSIAALITRGLAEISRFGVELGANKATFSGLSGLGDLVVTCTSKHSRNRSFGYKIGQGLSVDEAELEVGQVVEGIKTTRSVILAKNGGKVKTEMPITEEIYEVLFEEKDPLQAVDDLMNREIKTEIS